MTKQDKIKEIVNNSTKTYSSYEEYLLGKAQSEITNETLPIEEHNKRATTFEHNHYSKWVAGTKDKEGQVEIFNYHNNDTQNNETAIVVYTKNGPLTKVVSGYTSSYSGNFETEDNSIVYASAVEIPIREFSPIPPMRHEGYVDEQGNVTSQFSTKNSETAQLVQDQFETAYEQFSKNYEAQNKHIPITTTYGSLIPEINSVSYTE